jgi:16S rRNA (uracil1498-N3)-methyltransferase
MNLPDFRCFADVERLESGEVPLSPEESRHLSQARRAGLGAEVMVLNGRGDRGRGELIRGDKKAAAVRIDSVERCAPSQPGLTLYVGGLKQAAWDEVLRYAGELGVDRLVWLQSDHAVAELKKDRVEEKRARWRDKLIQSLKQCGNPFLPELAVCFSVEESLAETETEGEGVRLVAALRGEPAPIGKALAARGEGDIRVWIGPEGDFSEREYGWFAAAGVRPVSLGPRILRAETAVLATAAVLRLG